MSGLKRGWPPRPPSAAGGLSEEAIEVHLQQRRPPGTERLERVRRDGLQRVEVQKLDPASADTAVTGAKFVEAAPIPEKCCKPPSRRKFVKGGVRNSWSMTGDHNAANRQ